MPLPLGAPPKFEIAVCRPDLDKLRNKFVFALTRTSDQSAATLNATVAAEGYPLEANMAFVAGCGLSGKCSGADSTACGNTFDMIFEPFLMAPSRPVRPLCRDLLSVPAGWH